jgi:hypothetical protein
MESGRRVSERNLWRISRSCTIIPWPEHFHHDVPEVKIFNCKTYIYIWTDHLMLHSNGVVFSVLRYFLTNKCFAPIQRGLTYIQVSTYAPERKSRRKTLSPRRQFVSNIRPSKLRIYWLTVVTQDLRYLKTRHKILVIFHRLYCKVILFRVLE